MLHYFVKDFFAPVIASSYQEDGKFKLYVVSDLMEVPVYLCGSHNVLSIVSHVPHTIVFQTFSQWLTRYLCILWKTHTCLCFPFKATLARIF